MSRQKIKPQISVIISTYSIERFTYICECINSIKKQTLQPCEILLVLDPDPRLVSFYKSHLQEGVRLIISPRRGLSVARNVGIQNAKGDFIAFIDDDAIAKFDWLERLIVNCEDPSVIGVGGLVKPIWEHGRPSWFPEEVDWVVGCSYAGLPDQCCSVRNPIGCNMLFRKSVFQKVGLFDDNIGRLGKHLLGSEEAEFSIRALYGFPSSRIMYDPKAVVYHWVPNKRSYTSYIFRRSYYEGVSKRKMKNLIINKDALITESNYLNYLFKISFRRRIKRISGSNLKQMAILFCSMLLVLSGYLICSIQSSRKIMGKTKR